MATPVNEQKNINDYESNSKDKMEMDSDMPDAANPINNVMAMDVIEYLNDDAHLSVADINGDATLAADVDVNVIDDLIVANDLAVNEDLKTLLLEILNQLMILIMINMEMIITAMI